MDEDKRDEFRVIIDERKRCLVEMSEYNKRLDRTLMAYLAGLYAVIGVGVTETGSRFYAFAQDPRHAPLAFAFVFLNLCVATHALSQAAFSMSFAKFIHTTLTDRMSRFLGESGGGVPDVLTTWDDWETDVKGVAIQSRNAAVGLWMALLLAVSIYSLSLMSVRAFYLQNARTTLVIGAILFLFLVFVCYQGATLFYCGGKFHEPTEQVQIPTRRLLITAVAISTLLAVAAVLLLVFA